jgi:hypothetical protein
MTKARNIDPVKSYSSQFVGILKALRQKTRASIDQNSIAQTYNHPKDPDSSQRNPNPANTPHYLNTNKTIPLLPNSL